MSIIYIKAAPGGVLRRWSVKPLKRRWKSGRMTLEALGQEPTIDPASALICSAVSTCKWSKDGGHGGKTIRPRRVAVFKRTSDMLTGIINEDRNHLSLVQRHGWQGTEEGRYTGEDIAG